SRRRHTRFSRDWSSDVCSSDLIKDAVPVLRLKNHYAPSEEFWINEYRRVVPKATPYRYHLLRWKGLYFTNYYCFELADIIHRSKIGRASCRERVSIA